MCQFGQWKPFLGCLFLMISLLFVEHLLTFLQNKIFQAHFALVSSLMLEAAISSRIPASLTGEWYMKCKWGWCGLIATGLSLVPVAFSGNRQRTHACRCLHTRPHAFLYLCMYADNHKYMPVLPVPLLNYRADTASSNFQIGASLGGLWNITPITSALLNVANLLSLPGCDPTQGPPTLT